MGRQYMGSTFPIPIIMGISMQPVGARCNLPSPACSLERGFDEAISRHQIVAMADFAGSAPSENSIEWSSRHEGVIPLATPFLHTESSPVGESWIDCARAPSAKRTEPFD